MRLAVATPSGNLVHAGFHQGIVALAVKLQKLGLEVAYLNPRGPSIVVNRIRAVLDARAYDCTHILWIDSDVVVPSDVFTQLHAHHKSIVGAAYAKKVPPYPIAMEELMPAERGMLRRVARLPGGCLLVNMSVYESLGTPYYREHWPASLGEYYPQPEDYDFCDRARAAGFDVWLDAETSTRVQHLGEIAYRTNASIDIGAS